jgi:hypothetical protein
MIASKKNHRERQQAQAQYIQSQLDAVTASLEESGKRRGGASSANNTRAVSEKPRQAHLRDKIVVRVADANYQQPVWPPHSSVRVAG